VLDGIGAYDIWRAGRGYQMSKLTLSRELRERERLMDSGVMSLPKLEAPRGLLKLVKGAATGRLLRDRQHITVSRDELRGLGYLGLAAATMGLKQRSLSPKIGSGYWSGTPYPSRTFETFVAWFQVEQEPDPENRVILGATRDALGVPRVRILNRFTPRDRDSFLGSQRAVQQALRDCDLADMQEDGVEKQLVDYRGAGMAHHAGTTRMHDDPRRGVVDRVCRVHALSNLYCAGSSVFPTSGYANPTLTIVALAIRLADHLKGRTEPVPDLVAGRSERRPH
jgi:choline dehydrogenase-like flavoprotein